MKSTSLYWSIETRSLAGRPQRTFHKVVAESWLQNTKDKIELFHRNLFSLKLLMKYLMEKRKCKESDIRLCFNNL